MKNISVFFILGIFMLSFSPANAATVNWSSEQYTAYAYAGTFPYDYDTQYGPPFPVEAEAWLSPSSAPQATSMITDTIMFVSANYYIGSDESESRAEFSGAYNASADNGIFQFTYSLSHNGFYGPGYPSYPNTYAWLNVTDETDSVNLYSNNMLPLTDTQTIINISTLDGHAITVNFGIQAAAGFDLASRDELTLSYNTAIVPEPTSFILFAAGGAAIGLRRFRRKQIIRLQGIV